MKHKAIRIFLIGLLINPLLINIIGFISSFYSQLVLNDPEQSHYLLHLVQPYFLFVSVVFVAALYYLQKIDDRTWLKIICLLAALIYIVSSVYGFIPKGEYIGIIAKMAYHMMEAILLFAAVLILLKDAKKDLN